MARECHWCPDVSGSDTQKIASKLAFPDLRLSAGLPEHLVVVEAVVGDVGSLHHSSFADQALNRRKDTEQ